MIVHHVWLLNNYLILLLTYVIILEHIKYMLSYNVQKFSVLPTRTRIGLSIHAVWSESSMSALGGFVSLAVLNAPYADSD